MLLLLFRNNDYALFTFVFTWFTWHLEYCLGIFMSKLIFFSIRWACKLHNSFHQTNPEVTNLSTWGNILLKIFHFESLVSHLNWGLGTTKIIHSLTNMYYVLNAYVMVNDIDVVYVLKNKAGGNNKELEWEWRAEGCSCRLDRLTSQQS